MRSVTKIAVLLAAVIGLGALAARAVFWGCGPCCANPRQGSQAQGAASRPAAHATVTLEVSGMHCPACSITVRKALEAVPGVQQATVSFAPPRALVAYDPARATPEQLAKATAEVGYPSKVLPGSPSP
jgi:mercuric ion binding protein